MEYYEYIFTVLLFMTLISALWPESQMSLVACALLMVAIRKEQNK